MLPMFWFRPLFMLELLIAEGMFAFNLKGRKKFGIRLLCCIIACFGVSFALPYTISGSLYMSLMFVTMFAATVLCGLFCFEASVKSIVFCAIAGYTVQHIASECYETFNSLMFILTDNSLSFYNISENGIVGGQNYFFLFIYFVMFVLIYGIAGCFIVPKIEKYRIFQANNGILVAFSGFLLLIDVVIGTIIIDILPQSVFVLLTDPVAICIQILLHGYNILCCILAIILLIELPKRNSIESELSTITQLLNREREQYATVKNNIDMINIKCHDMKYQMRSFLTDKQVDSEEIKKMEDTINIYQSLYKTDNEALNVVLMEKSMLCKNKGIDLSCIIDASELGFMKDHDVYTLFGNIMDNAIEAVSRLSEGNRSIGLQIKKNGNFLMFNIYNGYAGKITFLNNLPVTTKGNTFLHGYGLKSIKYVVDKYDGELRIRTENQVFHLTILFQLSDKNKTQ